MKTWHYITLAYLGWAWYRVSKYGMTWASAITNPGKFTNPGPTTIGLTFTREGATYQGTIAASAKVDENVGEMIRSFAAGQAAGKAGGITLV